MEGEKTSTGLEPNIAGLLCYVLGWLTGIIFLVIEKDNKFVKFHAMQSIVVFGALTVISILVSIIQGIVFSAAIRGGAFGLLSVFGFISTIIWILWLVLAIILIIKAYQGETYKLPFAGDIAEKQLQ